MRLLKRNAAGEIYLTRDLLNDDIPRYAILSHTWGSDEVLFQDLKDGTGKNKIGHDKIRFCVDQAWNDGLYFCWVDTCCIDKSNSVELQEAINSMFYWYQKAAKCYVYLADVSTPTMDAADNSSWALAFQRSRWFKRGWTLQELLAPRSVEFFSREGKLLGDKTTLEQKIHEVTGISTQALQRAPLYEFSVEERLSWAKSRQTTRKEDRAYSLLGMFDIHMSLIYGEGEEHAFKRLRKKIDQLSNNTRPTQSLTQTSVQAEEKDQECLQHLRLTDPRDDKKRIEETKGGLLRDAYAWILESSDFQQWRDDRHSRLLWIKGDPGKGKTMLLCGIVNELNKTVAKAACLSYFFCQATDSRINNATAVLRGLVYLLIDQQPSLVSHIRKKYDHAGKALFEDANAWVALSEIFTNILQDTNLNITYLVIDALDECIVDLPKLLDFIVERLSVSSRVKWIVSSRNWPGIEECLERAGQRLSLELNAGSISAAVSTFIRHKVLQLATRKKYNQKTRDAVFNHLCSHANDTFLWVALVCQNLESIPRWNTVVSLDVFPPGLDCLYERMLLQISSSGNAALYKRILASIAIVYRPITLKELTSLVEMLEDMADDPESLQEIAGLCGSFLTVQDDTVYFVHQSARDFLLTKAVDEVFPSGIEETHYLLFSRSLQVMYRTLRRDMYNLRALGYPIEHVVQPDSDPLGTSRYSCIYWVDHLCDWNPNSSANHPLSLNDGGDVDTFLRKKYLYWLEALSLCKAMSQGVVSMAKLENLTQAYASALVFSPAHSVIRSLFKDEEPKWITMQPAMRDKWGACLQTFEGHKHTVNSVVFSHDSARLASASNDNTVKIWDAGNGACLRTLEGHSLPVSSVAFSHDSERLASASHDITVKIWNVSNGACLRTLEGHSVPVSSVAFTHDSEQLISASYDGNVKTWDVGNGICVQTLMNPDLTINSIALSHDSRQLALASSGKTITIWDTSNRICLQILKGHDDSVYSVAFSHDSARLASASRDKTIKIWDISGGVCIQTLDGHSGSVNSVGFSHNSQRLASTSYDRTIKVWDTATGICLQTLKGHSRAGTSVAFSFNSTQLASASCDRTVKIWDIDSGGYSQAVEGHSLSISSVVFSHDSTQLATASYDKTIKIWDVARCKYLQTLKGHSDRVTSVAFSHDSARLASASYDRTVKVWEVSSGMCLQTLEFGEIIFNISFDTTGSYLPTVGIDMLPTSDTTPSTTDPHGTRYRGVALSSDGTWITYNLEKLVWMPSEYRPSASAVSGKSIGIGVGSGRLWICTVELGQP
ncbi:WD40 repeat-like protein [Diaporthe amygdali]|uniref:WD40 repeat-like protein n=1 Tax=Phomopsis amygdali TaxID=1214568 RepID=UPI0022FDE9B7|nr:WD40 repeat-like protein [Diaporthe amygdali]KAJ0116662.1 WD40 repeat-like protein [Diaporthe amygdali]